MREIIFRGMDETGEWHYGYLTVLTQGIPGIKAGTYISGNKGWPFAYLVNPKTIGQYIGLKETTEKKRMIFEDDKVRINHEPDDNCDYIVNVFNVGYIRGFIDRRRPVEIIGHKLNSDVMVVI